jgi:hypothetical protein
MGQRRLTATQRTCAIPQAPNTKSPNEKPSSHTATTLHLTTSIRGINSPPPRPSLVPTHALVPYRSLLVVHLLQCARHSCRDGLRRIASDKSGRGSGAAPAPGVTSRWLATVWRSRPLAVSGRDEAVVREGPKNSVKKEAHLGPSNEGKRACKTRAAHPASPCSRGGSVKAAWCG